jgi:hypothetical protein
MDLTKFSDQDLDALESGNLQAMSDEGLAMLEQDEERTMVGQDKFDAASAQTSGQPNNFGMYGDGDGNVQGSEVGGVVQGMRDPIDALAHLMPKAGEAVMDAGQYVTSLGGGSPNMVSNSLGDASQWFNKEAQGVADLNARNNQAYEQQRIAANRGGGTDWMRLTGNVASPVNLAAASLMPLKAAGMGGMALQGTKLGAFGGATQPITDNENYWKSLGLQTGVGALGGAVATPLIGYLGKGATRAGQRMFSKSKYDEKSVMDEVEVVLAKIDQKKEDLSEAQLDGIKNSVREALKKQQTIDPEEMLAVQDFEKLGIAPTAGQRTRDPMQFALERNYRGVEGVGEPLQVRFTEQGKAVRKVISDLGGDKVEDIDRTSRKLSEGLAKYDKNLKKGVTKLYNDAKTSSGKDLDVPLTGLAQDFADISKRYKGDLSDGVLAPFKELGLAGGKKIKSLTIEEGEKILNNINKHYTGKKGALDSGLGELSAAVKKAISEAAPEGSVYAPAVKAARERFQLHDNIPALKSAFQGKVTPDKFVEKFIIKEADTEKLQQLSKLLKEQNPSMWKEVRSHIGDNLRRAGYGEDKVADATPNPKALARAIRTWGTDRLEAFYTKEEVDLLKTAARVTQKINVAPEGAAVSSSNSGNTAINIAKKIPMVGGVVQLGENAIKSVGKSRVVNKALADKPLAKSAQLSPKNQRRMAALLGAGGIGSGSATADKVKNYGVK